MIQRFELVFEVLGQVLDGDLEWVDDRHDSRTARVEILAEAMLQEFDLDHRVSFCDADAIAERADRLGRVPQTPHARQSRHARIVPTFDDAALDETLELALAHHRVGQKQLRELDLSGWFGEVEGGHAPIVQGAMILELQRTERMRDALDGVRDRVRVVVHRVDAPVVASPVVRGAPDAIEDWVPHVHVRRSHVDFRPQHVLSVLELASLHALEQLEVFFAAAPAKRTVRALAVVVAPLFSNRLEALAVDVGQAFFDELERILVQLFEVVGCEENLFAPVETQPAHVAFDGFDEVRFLGDRIRVVHA